MDTTITHQSKPTWRFERPHRVRLFTHRIHINELYNDKGPATDKAFYHQAAEAFSQTDRYHWAERNSVKLDFDIDERSIDWFKQVRFYADLSESEYTDYCLRFFDHHDEAWK